MINDLAYDGRTWTWILMTAIFFTGAVLSFDRARSLMVGSGLTEFPGREPGGRVFPVSGFVVIGWFALNLAVAFALVAFLRVAGEGAGRRYAVPVFFDSLPLIHAALWFFWRAGRGTILTGRDEQAIMAARSLVPPAPGEPTT